ncbi:MAG: hypothetical protein M1831_007332 [Alyxoria varia]|nr:MAG: hypothetical protein M1831_007332 [Alyxoria varia]
MATTSSNTVILGAGIIGTSTAYYLSQSSNTPARSIHLVEATPSLFSSASGYAAGFLASHWFGPETASLGELSFRLHRELAEKHGGWEKWGYSRSTVTSLADAGSNGQGGENWLMEGRSRAEIKGGGKGPSWLAKREGQEMNIISDGESTAQVDPKRLCEFLMKESRDRGVQLHHPAKAISVSKDMRGEVAKVRIARDDGEELDLPCSKLIITCGAWTSHVLSSLFPSAKVNVSIGALAGHSLLVRSPQWTADQEVGGCHAVFASDTHGFSPAIMSRVGGEIYIGGLNDSSLTLPEIASDAKPDPRSIETLKQVSKDVLGISNMDDLEILREGLCFRPMTERGPLLLCRMPDHTLGDMTTRGGAEGGVFISAGHGPWGIALSLGTGKVLAEIVEDQKASADTTHLQVV